MTTANKKHKSLSLFLTSAENNSTEHKDNSAIIIATFDKNTARKHRNKISI
jgi:hypothetical protein